jgi:hypothetical protein
MGTQCECMVLDPTQPFVGVQFVACAEEIGSLECA